MKQKNRIPKVPHDRFVAMSVTKDEHHNLTMTAREMGVTVSFIMRERMRDLFGHPDRPMNWTDAITKKA